MTTFKGRIGIIGAGALGAFYGARLAKAGHDVHFLMRSDYEAVAKNGLTIKSIDGDFHLNPPVYQSPKDLGICDLLIIGLKATANAALPDLLKDTVDQNTLVLTLQNGLGNEDAISKAMGPGNESRILGGIAFLCSNRIAPGVIDHIDQGWIRMGEFGTATSDRTYAIAELFTSSRIKCQVYDNLMQARWEKLVWNIPFNGLGAAIRANVAEVLSTPELHKVAENLMNEVATAAAATGAPISSDIPQKMLKNSESMGPYRSSMQVDLESGNPLEVEPIIGEPTRRALAAGCAVPHMEMLYAIVKHLDPVNRKAIS